LFRHSLLPPFPTRRSSDLLHVVEIAFFGGWIVVNAVAVEIIRGGKKKDVDIRARQFRVMNLGTRITESHKDIKVGHGLARADIEDRKSTRLNSSHEWISYA